MNQTNTNPEATLAVGAMSALIVAVVGVWGAAHAAYLIGSGTRPAGNPAVLLADLIRGRYQWTTAATLWAAVEGVLVVAAVIAAVMLVHRTRVKATHIDGRVGRLVRDRHGLRRYTDPTAAPVAVEVGPGPQIGRIVNG